MMPLAAARNGQEVILKAVNWGPKIKKRLCDMGLIPGVKVKVVSTDTNGAFIVMLKDSRLVLGGVVTQQIMVDIA